jgi:putative transposase
MQIQRMPMCFFKLANYGDRYKAKEPYLKKYGPQVDAWNKLTEEKVSTQTKQIFVGISRATYFRYKKVLKQIQKGMFPRTKRPQSFRKSEIPIEVKEKVLQIRRENPTYGKAKIAAILKRDFHSHYSESTIGRIIKEYMEKGIIIRSLSAPRKKKQRRFDKHAVKWKYEMKSKQPGEMVQVDHMTATKTGVTVKHFKAWDPRSKVIVAEAYSNATSHTAKKFLLKIIATAPYTLKSIQVDGGSEFMKEFEEECSARKIPLFVLPPKKPKYNGGVERGNRIFKEEFYYNRLIKCDSLGEVRNELREAVHKYNSYRPHSSLQNLTPYEYINQNMVA